MSALPEFDAEPRAWEALLNGLRLREEMGLGSVDLRIGCSSWTSPAWTGRFYPPGMADAERLSSYAGRFDCVEVDATYYAMLPAPVFASWARRTPADFRFTVKFPRDLMDPRKPLDSAGGAEFFRRAGLLGPKLAGVLLQFPPWFKPPRSGSAGNWGYLSRLLASVPRELPIALELRDAGWFAGPQHDALLGMLREQAITLAWSYLTYVDVPPDLTSDWVYLRFIGDHTSVPEDRHGSIVVDRTEPMRAWAQRLKENAARIRRALVFFNNHFAGYAPESVAQFRAILDAT